MNYATKLQDNKVKFEYLAAAVPAYLKYKVFAFEDVAYLFDIDELDERTEDELKEQYQKGSAVLRQISQKIARLNLN
jgi:hypothetical protein